MAKPDKKEADQELLRALACGATVEHAARKAGMSERSAYRRLANPEFRKQVSLARAEMVERTAGMLTVGGLGAVKTLRAESWADPLQKARALAYVAGMALKAIDTGKLAARIEILELVLKQRKGDGR